MIGSFLTRGLVYVTLQPDSISYLTLGLLCWLLKFNYLYFVGRMAFGYAYPAYECYKTVEMNKPEIEHLRFWCQYWYVVDCHFCQL
jgi:hypothetical protein